MDYSFEPEIEKLNVSCIINGVVDNAVLELQEDNDCRIILTVGKRNGKRRRTKLSQIGLNMVRHNAFTIVRKTWSIRLTSLLV